MRCEDNCVTGYSVVMAINSSAVGTQNFLDSKLTFSVGGCGIFHINVT